jgi:hypothetical protein
VPFPATEYPDTKTTESGNRRAPVLRLETSKANIRRICYDGLGMARRPEFPASVMTREELNRLRRSFSMLSPYGVRENYLKMLDKCRLREGVPPSPRMMKGLVALWRCCGTG